MSALAKPFIHTLSASGDVDPINSENLSSFGLINVDAVSTNNNKSLFGIQFVMRDNGVGSPNQIVWRYDTEAARDSDYATLLALVSNAI